MTQQYLGQFFNNIYGDGPLSGLHTAIQKRQNDHIRVYGFVQPEEVIPLLNRYDCFLSSVQEGFPYVLIESFSAGLMVIGTDVGGIKEALVDGENGF